MISSQSATGASRARAERRPRIGPTVEETLARLRHEGYEAVVIQPVGFLCDVLEILYDIDVVPRGRQKLGLGLFRAESLNDSPPLISALEDLAAPVGT